MDSVLSAVWSAVNSPLGITVVAGALLWGLNKLYSVKPLWQQYEGAVIAAVKYAEKAVPDDSTNTSLARLDAALKYVLQIYESAQGRKATEKEVADLTNGIQITHAQLEAKDQL